MECLYSDICFIIITIPFQFNVLASDNGEPPKNRTVGIYIRFKRDKEPQFNNLPRTVTVSENAEDDSVVFTVQGKDDDREVLKLSEKYCII